MSAPAILFRSLMAIHATRLRPDWPTAKSNPEDMNFRLCEVIETAEMTCAVRLSRSVAVALCSMLIGWIANKGAMPELVAQLEPLDFESLAFVLKQHADDDAVRADQADTQREGK